MAFMLEVEFAGLVKYLIQRDGTQVGILMPDGRQKGRPIEPYDFGEFKRHLVYHVGYIRYDLADTGVEVPTVGKGRTPAYEVVHRFDFEDLDFGLGFDQPMDPIKLDMPELRQFAPHASPKPGLFSPAPPPELLMRSIIRGGSLTTRPNGGVSEFNACLNPRGKCYTGAFAGSALWRRIVFDDELVLRLRTFGGEERQVIRLRPHGRDRIVRLKVANLCSENPLEWPELTLRSVDDQPDNDFKWFYFLWQDTRGSFPELLGQSQPHLLPVPTPLPDAGDVSNCTGSQHTVQSLEDA
jgi:hypothetical protein